MAVRKITQQNSKNNAVNAKRRKIRWKRRLIVFLFLACCIGAIVTILYAPFFNIAGVVCVGQQKLKEQDIIKAAQVNIGTNIFSTSIGDMKKRVASIPYVEDSNVRRIFPNKIKIWVREAKPTAYIETNKKYYIISKKCKIINEIQKPDKNIAEIIGFNLENPKIGDKIVNSKDTKCIDTVEIFKELEKLGMLDKLNKFDISSITDIKIWYDNRIVILIDNSEDIAYKLKFVKKVMTENLSVYERATMDYRGKSLYVGPYEDESLKATENIETKDNKKEQKDKTDQAEKKGSNVDAGENKNGE